ncbi:dihydrolipoyl dehydrogenase [Candidatus Micrarchaeota archaeon]|nr:dihydrolipoyl dehydrogenase [Candidatus Micrarchaeota archaeon]
MVMGELTTDVDVAVVGGGPGGYTAAIRAAQLGLDVALIEKDKLGGICTNVGCIPSKALIHAADVKHHAENSEEMGLKGNVSLDLEKTQKWKQKVVDSLVDGIASLCKMNGVEVIKGKAFFTSPDRLSVQTHEGLRSIHFKKAIIATGTVARTLDNLPADHEKIIDSDDALALAEAPGHLVILGGGYIAAEMANTYLKFGSRVTIVYRGERLLKRMDPEISRELLKGIKRLGGEVLFNTSIKKAEGNKAYLETPDGEKTLEFDKLLLAVGRVPHTEGLQPEKAGLKLNEKGLLDVDSRMKTSAENIYAVGDITPGPQLAHRAFRQGKVAAEVIAGRKSAFDNVAVPAVVFSDPEIAVAGMSKEDAEKQGYKVRTGKMPYSASGRARTMNAERGFAKIVADENNVVLGVQIAGPGAAQMISEAALAIEMGAFLEDIALTIHPHPTMPEAFMESAEDALGEAIHIYRKKK